MGMKTLLTLLLVLISIPVRAVTQAANNEILVAPFGNDNTAGIGFGVFQTYSNAVKAAKNGTIITIIGTNNYVKCPTPIGAIVSARNRAATTVRFQNLTNILVRGDGITSTLWTDGVGFMQQVSNCYNIHWQDLTFLGNPALAMKNMNLPPDGLGILSNLTAVIAASGPNSYFYVDRCKFKYFPDQVISLTDGDTNAPTADSTDWLFVRDCYADTCGTISAPWNPNGDGTFVSGLTGNHVFIQRNVITNCVSIFEAGNSSEGNALGFKTDLEISDNRAYGLWSWGIIVDPPGTNAGWNNIKVLRNYIEWFSFPNSSTNPNCSIKIECGTNVMIADNIILVPLGNSKVIPGILTDTIHNSIDQVTIQGNYVLGSGNNILVGVDAGAGGGKTKEVKSFNNFLNTKFNPYKIGNVDNFTSVGDVGFFNDVNSTWMFGPISFGPNRVSIRDCYIAGTVHTSFALFKPQGNVTTTNLYFSGITLPVNAARVTNTVVIPTGAVSSLAGNYSEPSGKAYAVWMGTSTTITTNQYSGPP